MADNSKNIFNNSFFQSTPQKTQDWRTHQPTAPGAVPGVFTGQSAQPSPFGAQAAPAPGGIFAAPGIGMPGNTASAFGSSFAPPLPLASSPFGTAAGIQQQSPFGIPPFQAAGTAAAPGTQQQMPFQIGTAAQPPSGLGSSFASSPFGTAKPSITTAFGSSQPQAAPPSIFGTQNIPSYSTTGQFGATQSSALPGFSSSISSSVGPYDPFKPVSAMGSTGVASSLFSGTAAKPLIGSTAGSAGLTGSAFPSQSSPWGGGAGGGWNVGAKGSKAASYTSTRTKDDTGIFVEVVDITAMKEYESKHGDEIRKEDYDQGRKPSQSMGGAVPFGSFGATAGSSFGALPSGSAPSATGGTAFPSAFGTASTAPSTALNYLSAQPTAASAFSPFPSSSLSQPSSLSSATSFPFNGNTAGNMPGNMPGNAFGNTGIAGNMTGLGASPFGTAAGQPAAPSPFMAPSNTTNLFQPMQQAPAPDARFTTPAQQPFAPLPSALNFYPGAAQQSPFAGFASNIFSKPAAAPSAAPALAQQSASQQPGPLPEYSDPYLVRDVVFEKGFSQKPSMPAMVPKPIFSTTKETSEVSFSLRPPNSSVKTGIYTIPDITDDSRSVRNLTVICEGAGKIEYLEPVTVSKKSDIERKIRFRNENVEVGDCPGEGLNKRARVYIEGIFPYSRSANTYIKGKAESWPNKGLQERFIHQLKGDPGKKFIDYNVDTGLYVYEVNHF